ncbi:sensor histidine kinase [Luteibacter pinisoli]|nr:sensor histidine kinase [Luteibacter pinisoli]
MNWWKHPRPDSLMGTLNSPIYLRWTCILQMFWLYALISAPWAVKGVHWEWILPSVLSMAVYATCYLRVFFGPLRDMVWNAGAIIVMGFALWIVNPVSIGYIVIALSMLAFAPSPRPWLIGTLIASLVTPLWVHWFNIPTVQAYILPFVGIITGVGNYLYARAIRRDVQLRLSQAEITRLATLAERERIGRDLHDLLGHTLSLITLKSELARRVALVDPPRAQQEMDEVERVARHALAEVRNAVTGMRAGDLGCELISARLMLEASGIALAIEKPAELALPAPAEAALSLVLREAVTNIHRHSRATEARVVITQEGQVFSMRITDNGCGGLAAHGNGVSGMRERVRQIGGRLAIDSPVKQGTALAIELTALAERIA